MDPRDFFRGASAAFSEHVHAISHDQWGGATPCADWDVRELVNHLVGEDRWAPPLLAGRTIAEVGDAFDGDLLGDDPIGAWDVAAADAIKAVDAEGSLDATVHLSYGDVAGRDYVMEIATDHVIHAWDLARAIGGDERLDPGLVETCAAWFAGREEAYRVAGAIGPRVPLPEGADPQTQLLATFGRDAG